MADMTSAFFLPTGAPRGLACVPGSPGSSGSSLGAAVLLEDLDGDGVPNYEDLDSDGDEIQKSDEDPAGRAPADGSG